MNRATRISKARELRAESLSYREIGRRLSVSDQTIRRWLLPELQHREKQYEKSSATKEYRKAYKKSRESHERVTYVIGSPETNKVIIGTTTNWFHRQGGYTKSLVPLKLLALTRIPEKSVLKRFAHLQAEGYSREVFELRDELAEWVGSFSPIFRWNECFVGSTNSTTREPTA